METDPTLIPRSLQVELEQLEREMAEPKPVADPEPVTPEIQTTDPEPVTDPDTPPTTPEPAPVETTDERLARLEAAHSTLKGKYSAEVPRYAEQIRQREAEIAELKARLDAKPETPLPPPVEIEKLRDEYGAELVDGLLSEMDRRVRGVSDKFKPLEDRVAQSARYRYEAERDSLVPDWRNIDANDDFRAWLSEEDPLTGQTRRELLYRADDDGNAKRVAAFYKTYSATTQKPATPGIPGKPSVAAQVMPSTTPAPPAPPKKRTYTLDEYEALGNQIAAGSASEPKLSQMRKEFDDALREGRITRPR